MFAIAIASSSSGVGDDGDDRAEDLLLGDRGVGVDVGEDGRLDVPAAVDVGAPAAADQPRTFVLAGLDVALDALALALR